MGDSLKPSGSCVKTFRMLLDTEHPEWLIENQKLFHEVQEFYCKILSAYPGLYELGSQQILRELEIMTIPSKSNPNVIEPIPWNKVPAYFRRAAINSIIGDLKSELTKYPDRLPRLMTRSSVVFYQRLYKDFTGKRITLHVWNGTEWVWLPVKLHGHELPVQDRDLEVKWMSPTVVIKRDQIFLNVPVKMPVSDGRKLKDRMTAGENICAVQFLNRNSFAVGCVLDKEGEQIAVHYIHGAPQYVNQCKRKLEQIEKSQKSGGTSGQDKANQKHWMKLKNLNEYWAHKVSRELLDFCKEYQVKVLTWEEYDPNYSKMIMKSAGNWSPLHLSNRIKEYLYYKAWGDGILIAPVKTFQIKERNFGEGCKGIQRARIVGRQCLNNFDK